MINLGELTQAVSDLNDEKVFNILENFLETSLSKEEIQDVFLACQKGMFEVGELFDIDYYYVSDLIFAGELMSQIVKILKTRLQGNNAAGRIGSILLGTVESDFHDIGKNLFKTMAEAEGFEVYDLGVDVAPPYICGEIKRN